MIGMGFAKTWDQMAALRVVLGIMEAGFFPSCVYLLSTWYTRCTLRSLELLSSMLTDWSRRGGQAERHVLYDRLHRVGIRWYPGIRCKS